MPERKQEKAMHYILVYGTLKSGHRNNPLLDGQNFIQKATTKPKYNLYDNGSFPMMTKSENGHLVRGEVWQITDACLRRLDQLEGAPHMYKRETVELEDFDKSCIAYFYQLRTSSYEECGEEWN